MNTGIRFFFAFVAAVVGLVIALFGLYVAFTGRFWDAITLTVAAMACKWASMLLAPEARA